MKKLFLLLALALATIGFGGCNEDSGEPVGIPVTELGLDLASDFIEIGEEVKLSPIVTPFEATDKNVSWSSDNDVVATVSEGGVVRGVSVGEATITARSGNLSAECSITVMTEVIDVVSISLNETEVELAKEGVFQLVSILNPEDASDTQVIWASLDEATATVSATGLVTARRGGITTITATTNDAGLVARCVVTVNVPLNNLIITPAEIGPDKDVSILPGQTVPVKVSFDPEDALNKNFSVGVLGGSSSIITYAIDENDPTTINVTAIAPGTTTLIITAEARRNGTSPIQYFQAVTVSQNVTSITLDKTDVSVNAGSEISISATVAPENAVNKDVEWSSSDTSLATVDQNGTVTGIAAGTAVITATAADGGGATTSCTVYVKGADPVFGFVSFRSDQTWTLGSWIWSDYVMATRCKTDVADYNPLSERGDCLDNGEFYDLFSYNALVSSTASLFCVDGWQRPAMNAYEAADMALYPRGGPWGPPNQTSGSVKWVSDWGLIYGGYYDGTAIVREETDTVSGVTSAFARHWKGWPTAGNPIAYFSLYEQAGPNSQAINSGNAQVVSLTNDTHLSMAMAIRCVKPVN